MTICIIVLKLLSFFSSLVKIYQLLKKLQGAVIVIFLKVIHRSGILGFIVGRLKKLLMFAAGYKDE
jgi:F420-0:gamma-glutamyl ligase-like protein